MVIKLRFIVFQWCWVPFASWAQPRPFLVIHPCCLKKPSRPSHRQICSLALRGYKVTQKPPKLFDRNHPNDTSLVYLKAIQQGHHVFHRSMTSLRNKWHGKCQLSLADFYSVCTMIIHLFCCTLIHGNDAHREPHLSQDIYNNCAKMAFNIFYFNDSNYYCLHLF